MTKQEALNRQGQQYIASLAATARQLWGKACEFDGILADSKFVVFSKDNKFAEFYNIAMCRLVEARAEYAAGGYVGLQMKDSRRKRSGSKL